jgi:glycosyltransferase involved in cell wall biosynthesis
VDEVLALEAAGETVLIDTLEPPREEPRHPGLSALRAEVRCVPDTGDELERAAVIARRCSRARARLVHTHFAVQAADVAAAAARLAGRPLAITAHAYDIWQADNASHLERRLSAADGVVTVSDYNARHLRSVVPRTAVHVVPLAVAPAEPAPAPADGPILCVARLIPKKGVDTLIRALALLADERPGLRLELIGTGRVEGELRALAGELGVESRIAFRGAKSQQAVHEAYERCSVVALACRVAENGDRDGLPVVLLEALARALPVVTTAVAGIPEVVKDRVTGLLVPPDDPQALARGLGELLDDRELARRLGASGRQLVRQTRSPAARVDALRRVLG